MRLRKPLTNHQVQIHPTTQLILLSSNSPFIDQNSKKASTTILESASLIDQIPIGPIWCDTLDAAHNWVRSKRDKSGCTMACAWVAWTPGLMSDGWSDPFASPLPGNQLLTPLRNTSPISYIDSASIFYSNFPPFTILLLFPVFATRYTTLSNLTLG